ncbi:MAG: serine/threonine protein kinase [Acidobacteriia bacterium]|nr:serine/threonine protein kinase [Terriglobia bacterium]
MDGFRYEQIHGLFQKALDLPETELAAFFENACGNDAELIAEVRAMLAADGRQTSLLDVGLSDVVSRVIGHPIETSPGEEFGPYRLVRLLGEGGMGVVWLAERKDVGNLVAIKFLPHAGLSPARRERFTREITTLGKLKHSYIARLYDAGTLGNGTPWFAMEYVEGVRSNEYWRTGSRSVEERLRLFRKVCEAVQYAHGQEIIHRDLKPSNILVERDGTPRLLDFGIARELQSLDAPGEQTRPGLRFLSPDYAAPEWIRDGSVGFYTDVYSLGVILYEMLTGKLPFARSHGAATNAHALRAGGPENPSVSGSRDSGCDKAAWNDLDVLCLKAISQDPQSRYQSVEALIRDIDHYLKGEPLEGRPDSFSYRAGKFVTRNRNGVLAIAAALLLVIGLVVFFTVRLARERDVANRETTIETAMNRFLSEDLLAQADPFKSGNDKELLKDVVDQASSRIDRQFQGEPVLAGRLHQEIAAAFDNRSDYARARQEYQRADELFRRGEGPQSQNAMIVRLRRAAMEARSYERGSRELAKSIVSEIEKQLSQIKNPKQDLAVWIAVARGVIAINTEDARSANEHFLAALHEAQKVPSFDPGRLRTIRQMLAHSYIRLGQGAKAESLLRESIAELSKTLGPENPILLQARTNLAEALLVERKFTEGIQETNFLYPALVRKLGEDHEITQSVLGTRAASEGMLGLWDAAIRDDLKFYNLQVLKHGPSTFGSIAALSDAAQSQCQAGRYRAGELNARKAFQLSQQAFGSSAGTTGAAAYSLAVCLTRMNRLEEASELLRRIDIKPVIALTGDSTIPASIAMAQGEIALRRGDYRLAERYVQTAAVDFERPDAAPINKREIAKLKKAVEEHLQPGQ